VAEKRKWEEGRNGEKENNEEEKRKREGIEWEESVVPRVCTPMDDMLFNVVPNAR